MQTFKYILITIGIIAIVLTILFIVLGIKVVSSVFMYVLGAIAILAIIGFIIYYVSKFFINRNSRNNN
ncbi:MAG: hypothetical protein LUG18_03315 [Candidatus Azobacteroides sp.]|nr:hypothetical protein [Candidatus Azobacteroides sp.]